MGGVTAVLYAATAIVLLWLADRYVLPISRGAAIALLLLPLVFTGRAVLTGRVYAPVEMPYMTRPLYDYRAALHVPPTHNPTLADIAFQMIPWREATRNALAHGEWPLLHRSIASGDVLAASMQPAVYSPFTWIACLVPAAESFSQSRRDREKVTGCLRKEEAPPAEAQRARREEQKRGTRFFCSPSRLCASARGC